MSLKSGMTFLGSGSGSAARGGVTSSTESSRTLRALAMRDAASMSNEALLGMSVC